MLKLLSICAAVSGAVVASQIPAFTQQYTQRLGGQVDALTSVVMDFDSSALEAGLGREQALAQMTGTEFLNSRQSDMRGTFARHANLTEHLAQLKSASPLQRLAMPHRIADGEVFATAWADFEPNLPLTSAGVVAGGSGAVLGWGGFAAIIALLSVPFRRRRKPSQERKEPQFRPQNIEPEQANAPQLFGEVR